MNTWNFIWGESGLLEIQNLWLPDDTASEKLVQGMHWKMWSGRNWTAMFHWLFSFTHHSVIAYYALLCMYVCFVYHIQSIYWFQSINFESCHFIELFHYFYSLLVCYLESCRYIMTLYLTGELHLLLWSFCTYNYFILPTHLA